MADPESVHARHQELLDGQTVWAANDLPNRDPHVFYHQFVLPLRALRDRGIIEKLLEHKSDFNGYPGRKYIDHVIATSGIDLQTEADETKSKDEEGT